MRKVEVPFPEKLFSDLDRSSGETLHYQVFKRIEQTILSGKLAPGDRIENEVSLSQRLNLSRPTVRRAIEELVSKGLLVRRPGIGTQVVHGRVTRGLELTSLFDDLVAAGKTPFTRVIEIKKVQADKIVASELGLTVGDDVLFIHRLRGAGSTPVAVMQNWLNWEFSKLTKREMEDFGLYAWLRSQGAGVQVAKQKIGARKASSEESRLLELENHDPVLTMSRTAYDNSGHAIEYGHHCYRTDLYSFEFTLVGR